MRSAFRGMRKTMKIVVVRRPTYRRWERRKVLLRCARSREVLSHRLSLWIHRKAGKIGRKLTIIALLHQTKQTGIRAAHK